MITPSIDPFCAKNEPLTPAAAQAILQYVGLLGGDGDAAIATFRRRDGSPGRVDRRVDILQTGPPPPPETPLVVQLSRWDRIKDMQGVLHAFAEHVDRTFGAHLMLVGPAVRGVTDDPEGGDVLDDCIEAWQSLPHSVRTRIHLACVPMQDPDEAAVIVNALQRHATVVTQKSLAEGFGLTVVEAMWKHRPVVATRVGGIVDQIVDGESGLLIDDPSDLGCVRWRRSTGCSPTKRWRNGSVPTPTNGRIESSSVTATSSTTPPSSPRSCRRTRNDDAG